MLQSVFPLPLQVPQSSFLEVLPEEVELVLFEELVGVELSFLQFEKVAEKMFL